jgi:hypothetical protein
MTYYVIVKLVRLLLIINQRNFLYSFESLPSTYTTYYINRLLYNFLWDLRWEASIWRWRKLKKREIAALRRTAPLLTHAHIILLLNTTEQKKTFFYYYFKPEIFKFPLCDNKFLCFINTEEGIYLLNCAYRVYWFAWL